MKSFYACNFRLPTLVAELALRRKISNWLRKIFQQLNGSEIKQYILPKITNKVTVLTENLAAAQRSMSRAWQKNVPMEL
jgi:hypothetical protein